VGVVRFSDMGDITQAGEAARIALAGWSALSPPARGAYLFKAAGLLEASLPELAELASREMGKPITEMRGEVMRGVHLLRYYAAEGVRSIGHCNECRLTVHTLGTVRSCLTQLEEGMVVETGRQLSNEITGRIVT
jgi:acyl-CoA reductase-like NAD-dependent aldehyde dehydrogenase